MDGRKVRVKQGRQGRKQGIKKVGKEGLEGRTEGRKELKKGRGKEGRNEGRRKGAKKAGGKGKARNDGTMESYFGYMRAALGITITSESLWDDFGVPFGSLGAHLGFILISFWVHGGHFGPLFGHFRRQKMMLMCIPDGLEGLKTENGEKVLVLL